MNLVDAVVLEVIHPPVEVHGVWWVGVKYNSWGHINTTDIMFRDKSDALAATPGYKFEC